MSKGFVNKATHLEPPPLGVDELKRTIPIESILIHYGRKQGKNGKWQCPVHRPDKDPSALVNDTRTAVYCFACGRSYDLFDVVMELECLTFREALYWLNDHAAVFPQQVDKKIILQRRAEYKGAVPINLLQNWWASMTDRRKALLHQTRGITPRTSTRLGLGYDTGLQAWAIPFWRGLPKKSRADVLQFRATEKSIGDWRYIGQTGHNRPSVINRHMINPFCTVLVFGTFDSILAVQDGLPVVSTNGSTVFDDLESVDAQRLKEMFEGVKGFIVPDNTPSEYVSAIRIARFLDFEVRYFPPGDWGKDYCDYRKTKTAEDFLTEVIQMPEIWALKEEHVQTLEDILMNVSAGRGDTATELLSILILAHQDYTNIFNRVRRGLMLSIETGSFRLDPIYEECPEYESSLTEGDWALFQDDLDSATGIADMKEAILRWSEEAALNMGVF